MIALLDSSVVARKLLGEPQPLSAWSEIGEAFASRLLKVELGRLIDRLRLTGLIDDEQVVHLQQELRRLLLSVEQLGFTGEILNRAAGAMPTVVGTLDGIHLATAVELQRELDRPVSVATHDVQLARAARALGFTVIGA